MHTVHLHMPWLHLVSVTTTGACWFDGWVVLFLQVAAEHTVTTHSQSSPVTWRHIRVQ
jgi:hypothetical protein